MAFRVVIDACVLYPFALRDALLYAAYRDLFAPTWSEQILEENATVLVAALDTTFPEAMVDQNAVDGLVVAMRNDKGDRRVTAAAVASGSEQIATVYFNTSGQVIWLRSELKLFIPISSSFRSGTDGPTRSRRRSPTTPQIDSRGMWNCSPII